MSACRTTTNCVRRRFLLLRNYAFYFLLLLLCGDVELNPGPQVQLKGLLDGQQRLMAKLNQIEANQASADSRLNDVCNRIGSVEAKIDKLDNIQTVLQEYKEKCDAQLTQIPALSSRVETLENRSRRSNLIFYGFPESNAKETAAACEELVTNLCHTRLGVDDILIEKAYRLGKQSTDRNRPIFASFRFLKDKERIMFNARKLKGTNLSISEDLSESVRVVRKHLWEYAKAHRRPDSKVVLKHDCLLLDGVKFTWDDEAKLVIQH